MAILTLDGIVFDPANIENSITSKYWIYPSGTKKLFYQENAPTGWIKDTSQNNKMLRVVSGSGGTSGGSISMTSAFPSSGKSFSAPISSNASVSGNVGGTTLSLSQLPDHTHTGTMGSNGGSNATPFSNAGTFTVFGSVSTGGVIESSGGGSHTHPWSGNISLSTNIDGTASNFDIQYIDVIICTLS